MVRIPFLHAAAAAILLPAASCASSADAPSLADLQNRQRFAYEKSNHGDPLRPPESTVERKSLPEVGTGTRDTALYPAPGVLEKASEAQIEKSGAHEGRDSITTYVNDDYGENYHVDELQSTELQPSELQASELQSSDLLSPKIPSAQMPVGATGDPALAPNVPDLPLGMDVAERFSSFGIQIDGILSEKRGDAALINNRLYFPGDTLSGDTLAGDMNNVLVDTVEDGIVILSYQGFLFSFPAQKLTYSE